LQKSRLILRKHLFLHMKWKLRESNGMKLCTCDMFAELQFNLFFGP